LEYPDRRDDSPGKEKAGQDREADHEDNDAPGGLPVGKVQLDQARCHQYAADQDEQDEDVLAEEPAARGHRRMTTVAAAATAPLAVARNLRRWTLCACAMGSGYPALPRWRSPASRRAA